MSERKRFHPIAIIAYFIKSIKGFFVFILLVLLDAGSEALEALPILVGIIAFSLLVSLIKYFTHSYKISEEKIVVYKGIFVRKEREIPYERIQTIKQRQWFFYKPFNLVQILIETGSTSDKEAEASLACVDSKVIHLIETYRHERSLMANKKLYDKQNLHSETANDFQASEEGYTSGIFNSRESLDSGNVSESRKFLNSSEINSQGDEDKLFLDQDRIYQYRMSYKDILLYALTDLNIFLILIPIIVFVIEIFSEFDFLLDMIPDAVFRSIDIFLAQAAWIIILVSFISSMILLLTISLIKNFFYYFDFTVTCTRKTITIEYGFFERKTQKIPLNKVQGIKIYQQVLRKLLGVSSVEVIIIGGQETKGESNIEDKLLLLPLISYKALYPALAQIFPTYITEVPKIRLVGQGKLFYFWRWNLLFGLVAIPVGFYFFTWLGIILSIISIILLIFQWLDYRYQGYAFSDKKLIVIQNFYGFSKVQTFLNISKIQAYDKKTSFFLLRRNLGHIYFHIKSGIADMSVGLRFVEGFHINTIEQYFDENNLVI